MRVLITGSAGFIGSHLGPALRARGHEVLGLDRLARESKDGEKALACDILDGRSLTEQFRAFRPEALIHLAARTDLEGRTLEDYAPNTQGVFNVISAVRETPTLKRAIFTSTQLVCKLGYVPRDDTDYRPSTVYGQSKIRTEQIVREEDGGGVSWCLVRPTTIWGPGMSAHYQRFLRMLALGRYVHVGRAPVRKTYGYVRNVVAQYIALLEADPELIWRRTFYLGDYEPLSLREWADSLAAALGGPPIKTMPWAAARAGALAGDLLNTLGWKTFPFNSFRLENVLTESVFDLAPTRTVCGDLPFTNQKAVEDTARWFREVMDREGAGQPA